MCLTISNIRHGFINPKPRIAEDNIIVYKVLDDAFTKYVTPFQRREVTFFKGKACLKDKLWVHKIHLFKWIVSKGIHAYTDVFKALLLFRERRYVIFKAIIPKGTKYFIGRDDDIVSEKLIIFKDNIALGEWLEKD